MIIVHPDGLHEGVDDGGADETETTLLEVFAEGIAFGGGSAKIIC